MFATSTQTQQTQTTTYIQKDYRPDFIFVLQTIEGKIIVGQANNVSKRVASINSGHNRLVPKPMSIHSIVGVKPQTEGRTFAGVVRKMISRYGEDNVIAV